MKRDRKNELKRKDNKELTALVADAKEKLSRLVFDLKSGKTSQVKEIKNLKKEAAFMLTLIKQQDEQNGKTNK